ncbi:MAG: hypothetical protein N2645_13770 [Clostridia bacterium]|nr:hypothetical protein [Clostridia bacterium]
MRKWTESDAIDHLLLCGAERVRAKVLVKKGGWNGLKACSAVDYLKKLNYTFKFITGTTLKGKTNTKEHRQSDAGVL